MLHVLHELTQSWFVDFTAGIIVGMIIFTAIKERRNH